jgi:hypothetical protein
MILNADKSILASIMLARIHHARQSFSEAISDAEQEYDANIKWLASDNAGRGSFVWFCGELALEPDAVRDAIANGFSEVNG